MKQLNFLLTCCLVLLLGWSAQAQFITDYGTNRDEQTWATTKNSAGNGYVAVGNAFGNNNKTAWIHELDNAGNVLGSNQISFPPAAINMEITDISSCGAGTNHYYITGHADAQSTAGIMVTKMFVARVDAMGNTIWWKERLVSPNIQDPTEGIAVVTANNGDVFVVGNYIALAGGPSRIIAARFNAAGALVWSNIYNTNDNGSYMAREADRTFAPCGNVATTPVSGEGIAITGEVRGSVQASNFGVGTTRTFVMTIGGNGTECWRNIYPAGPQTNYSNDFGTDLWFDPTTNQYQVIGVAQSGNAAGVVISQLYMLRLDLMGNLLCGNVYNAAGSATPGTINPLDEIYPRSITRSRTGNNFVIAGAAPMRGAFMAEFQSGCNTLNPVWANQYTSVSPTLITPSIAPFGHLLPLGAPEQVLPSISSNGYVLSATQVAGSYGGHDAIFIETDAAGQTPNACPATPIIFNPNPAGIRLPIQFVAQLEPNWVNAPYAPNPYPVQQVQCATVAPCSVTASFSSTASGATVTFSNSSTGSGALTYFWDFGDANTSTSANPTHTYAAGGAYNVCLYVTNVDPSGVVCTDTICQWVQVSNPCAVSVNFTVAYIGCLGVKPTATATGGTAPYTYVWSWGDATPNSTGVSPATHTYVAGTYTLCVTVTDALGCTGTHCMTVQLPRCKAAVDFCYSATNLNNTIAFTSTATGTGTVTRVWNFGDGTTSTATNPSKTYTSPGTYNVCLTVTYTNCGITCSATCCKTVVVLGNCNIGARFTYSVNGMATTFSNTSTAPTGSTHTWNYGDGSPLVTFGAGGSHTKTYTTPGTYTVCLTVSNTTAGGSCESTVCRKVSVDPPCFVVARMRAKACLSSPYNVTFTNLSTGGGTLLWNFGDGNTSTAPNPVHTYGAVGTYPVTLTITDGPCMSKVIYNMVVDTPLCNTVGVTARMAPEEEYYDLEMYEVETTEDYNDGAASIKVYPNPANVSTNISFDLYEQEEVVISIIDMKGNAVWTRKMDASYGSQVIETSLQDIPNGLYIVQILGNKTNLNTRLMVQN